MLYTQHLWSTYCMPSTYGVLAICLAFMELQLCQWEQVIFEGTSVVAQR